MSVLAGMLCLHCRCDADPVTLARYVAALIKKDKPEDDLRKICLKKLHIFLQTRKESIALFVFCISRVSLCLCILLNVLSDLLQLYQV